MRVGLYSIFDKVASVYNAPFVMPADAAALRAFRDILSDKGTVPGRHPGDFSLVRIGSFDDSSGEVFFEGVKSVVESGPVEVMPDLKAV